MLTRRAFIPGLVLCVALVGSVASAGPLPPMAGTVIVAQTTADGAHVIWDATPYVAQLVSDKVGGEAGMRAVEATALQALAEKSKDLSGTTLTLSVTYARTGAVSPVYKTATFAGFEQLLTIVAKRSALAEHAAAWKTQLAKGTVPRGLTVSVTGKLPPV